MANCRYCGKELSTNKHFCSSTCYGHWQHGKSFSEQQKPMREKKYCSVDGCHSVHFGKGYCRKHYIKNIVQPKEMAERAERSPHTKDKCTSTGIETYRCAFCGKEFHAYIRTNRKLPKFCSQKCAGMFHRKPFIIKKGYKKVLLPAHPRSDKKGYVFEHIVILESVLCRPICNGEECHHIDGNRMNNSPDNLILFPNHSEHMKHHARPS